MAKCGLCAAKKRVAEFKPFTTDPSLGSVYSITFRDSWTLVSQITNEMRDVRKDQWINMYGSDIAYWLGRGTFGIIFESNAAQSQFLSEHPEVQLWQLQ